MDLVFIWENIFSKRVWGGRKKEKKEMYPKKKRKKKI